MYIDFHVHAYPEKIAEKAVSGLEDCYKKAGIISAAAYRGTVTGLRQTLIRCGIDKAVLLPAATRAGQAESINSWAYDTMNSEENSDGRLICFGAVHPDDEDTDSILEGIAARGMKGVKLHPEASGVAADDERYMKICGKCAELGLITLFHMGADPAAADKTEEKSTPRQIAAIADRFPALIITGAHLGGMGAYEDTMKYLCGRRNVYLDTAFADGCISDEAFCNIVRAHGADRILFGSDMPWHLSSQEKKMIGESGLTEHEKNMIFYENAVRLLGIDQ